MEHRAKIDELVDACMDNALSRKGWNHSDASAYTKGYITGMLKAVIDRVSEGEVKDMIMSDLEYHIAYQKGEK